MLGKKSITIAKINSSKNEHVQVFLALRLPINAEVLCLYEIHSL